ncbi:SET and MYND domain-containing protein 5 [Araneus ventricosus]|uniref:SET and MYND domain-containing protein 5 n=1 Tax=Araneus ventricosus TaxID=182803 RepID=A0A4Y2D7Y4_ARAVE|nr:SET and MYND domain-containing protein 5 [Araneus ventricosus]
MIFFSAFGVWVKNCDSLDLSPEEKEKLNVFIHDLYESIEKETGPFLNNEGSGLYPLQSACNHSCVPNAEATFPYNNFTLVMEAIKEIQPGERYVTKDLSFGSADPVTAPQRSSTQDRIGLVGLESQDIVSTILQSEERKHGRSSADPVTAPQRSSTQDRIGLVGLESQDIVSTDPQSKERKPGHSSADPVTAPKLSSQSLLCKGLWHPLL